MPVPDPPSPRMLQSAPNTAPLAKAVVSDPVASAAGDSSEKSKSRDAADAVLRPRSPATIPSTPNTDAVDEAVASNAVPSGPVGSPRGDPPERSKRGISRTRPCEVAALDYDDFMRSGVEPPCKVQAVTLPLILPLPPLPPAHHAAPPSTSPVTYISGYPTASSPT